MGFFRRKILKVALAGLGALPFFSGCGLVFYLKEDPEHKEIRRQGYELCHLESCGPQALEEIFLSLGLSKTALEIGKEIQDRDKVHYRSLLGVLHHRFTRITCPFELFSYCSSQGLTVTKSPYLQLTPQDVAIILIKGPNEIEDWHWIAWPKKPEVIESYFGDQTKIVSAHIITTS